MAEVGTTPEAVTPVVEPIRTGPEKAWSDRFRRERVDELNDVFNGALRNWGNLDEATGGRVARYLGAQGNAEARKRASLEFRFTDPEGAEWHAYAADHGDTLIRTQGDEVESTEVNFWYGADFNYQKGKVVNYEEEVDGEKLSKQRVDTVESHVSDMEAVDKSKGLIGRFQQTLASLPKGTVGSF